MPTLYAVLNAINTINGNASTTHRNFDNYLYQDGQYNLLQHTNNQSLYAEMRGPNNVIYSDGNGRSLVNVYGRGNNANLSAFLGSGDDYFYAYNPTASSVNYGNYNTAWGLGRNTVVAQDIYNYNVDTGSGNDHIDLGYADSRRLFNIQAGTGNDTLIGNFQGTKNFSLDMGDGNDTVAVDLQSGSEGTIHLGSGDDAAFVNANGSDVLINAIGTGTKNAVISSNNAEVAYLGGINSDTIVYAGDHSTAVLDGNSGNDDITAHVTHSDLLVTGGNGNDDIHTQADFYSNVVVDGGNNNDTIQVSGNGRTTVEGGNGNDVISAGGMAGQYTINGGNGQNQTNFLANALASMYTFNGGLDNELFVANNGQGIGATYNMVGGGSDTFRLTSNPYASEFFLNTDAADFIELAGLAAQWNFSQEASRRVYTNLHNGNIVYVSGGANVRYTG